jgi:GxxExxY protein
MTTFAPIPEETEKIGRALLDAAIEVHRSLGPGFLERIYEEALCHELTLHNTPFECQKPIQVLYKGAPIGEQRLDLLIGNAVIAEIKAVKAILPIHEAQLISYLKTTGLRLGFIINFKVRLLKNGIKRMVL